MSESYLSKAGTPQSWKGGGDLVLGHVATEAEGTTAECRFRIYTPDSRLRVKVSIKFVRDDPTNTTSVDTHAATLYLGEEEEASKGGKRVLSTDILRDSAGTVVHVSTPLAIPEDADLDGFTVEFVTAADSILGIFTTGQAGPSGHWLLGVRFQPDGQRLCAEDWDYVQRKCHPTLLTPEINLTENL